jgi:hypothetical protein
MAPRAALAATSQLESDPPPVAATQRRTCLNCGTLLTDAFCAHCGQRAGDAHLSVRDIAHEAVAEHFGLDSKVARTLITLMRHPGRLTIEFLSGRRVRYVPPLRLYLSLSVLFFLCSAISARLTGSNTTGVIRFNTSGAKERPGQIISFDTTALGQSTENAARSESVDSTHVKPNAMPGITIDTMHGNAFTLFLRRRIDRRAAYMQGHRAEASARISEAFQHDLPDALFLLVPGLAFALWVLYHGENRYFAEHLVFAMHFQGFAFAALTIGLLPVPFIDSITGLAILVYLFLALRRVYGQGLALTTGKFAAIVVGYSISLAVIMGVVAITAFLFA